MEKVRHKSYVQKVIHVKKVRYKKLDMKLIITNYVQKVTHKSLTRKLQFNTETTT